MIKRIFCFSILYISAVSVAMEQKGLSIQETKENQSGRKINPKTQGPITNHPRWTEKKVESVEESVEKTQEIVEEKAVTANAFPTQENRKYLDTASMDQKRVKEVQHLLGQYSKDEEVSIEVAELILKAAYFRSDIERGKTEEPLGELRLPGFAGPIHIHHGFHGHDDYQGTEKKD